MELLVEQHVRAYLEHAARLRGYSLTRAEAAQAARDGVAAWGRRYPALAWVGGIWVDPRGGVELLRTSSDDADEHRADLLDALSMSERAS